MLALEPSPKVIVFYALALLLAVAGFLLSAFSEWQLIAATVSALLLTVMSARHYWVRQRGVLFFGESGWAWQPQGGAPIEVDLKVALGWSDRVLQITVVPTAATGVRRFWGKQLFIFPDNCEASQRRRLRAFVIAENPDSH